MRSQAINEKGSIQGSEALRVDEVQGDDFGMMERGSKRRGWEMAIVSSWYLTSIRSSKLRRSVL